MEGQIRGRPTTTQTGTANRVAHAIGGNRGIGGTPSTGPRTDRFGAALHPQLLEALAAVATEAKTREEREEELVREPLRDSLRIARRVDLDKVEADDPVAAAEVE